MGTNLGGNGFKTVSVQHGTLATDVCGINFDQSVDAHFTWPLGRIPRAGTNVHPQSAGCCFLGSIQVMILSCHLQYGQSLPTAGDDQDGPVLALRRIFLEWQPNPNDFAGVGFAIEMGRVFDVHAARLPHPCTESLKWRQFAFHYLTCRVARQLVDEHRAARHRKAGNPFFGVRRDVVRAEFGTIAFDDIRC